MKKSENTRNILHELCFFRLPWLSLFDMSLVLVLFRFLFLCLMKIK